MPGLLSDVASVVPDFLKGTSPAEQRIAQGGSLAGNLGGILGDVGSTLSDYTPAGGLRQMFSPQGAGLAALAGLGGALAIHGYHQWKAGAIQFGSERGSFGLPSQQSEGGAFGVPGRATEMPPVAGAPSWANTEYKRGLYPDRVQRIIDAQSPQDVALALTKHDPQYPTVVGRHLLSMTDQIDQLGQRAVQQIPAHQGQDPFAAGSYLMAQLDTAYHRGLIDSPAFNADYERFLTRAHTFGEEQPLFQQAALALGKELSWTYSPDLAMPPSLDLVKMHFGADGPETTVGVRRGSLPHDVTDGDQWFRERALEYQAAIPMLVDNKLHAIGNAQDITEPYSQAGRSGAPDPFEARLGNPQWYPDMHNALQKMATEMHLDPFEVVPQVVSALSPRAKWGANVAAARQMFTEYQAAKAAQGGTLTRPWLAEATHSSRPPFAINGPKSVTDRYPGILPESVWRAQRLLLGESPEEVLATNKIRNFGENLSKPYAPYPVTIDSLDNVAGLGYASGDTNPVVFDTSPRGQNAYEAQATANRVVARYLGHPAANMPQAHAWGPVSYIANRVKGGFSLNAPSDLRTVVLGWGNPGPGYFADQATSYSDLGDRISPDFDTVTRDPTTNRKLPNSHLNGHAAYITARPDGTFVVWGRGGDNVRPVLRTLRPIGEPAPVNRLIPVVPRVVEGVDQLDHSLAPVGRGVPAASRSEVHHDSVFGVSHPATLPQNWFHYVVDGQDEPKLQGIQAAVKNLVPDARMGVAKPHVLNTPDAPLRHLSQEDLEDMGPEVFASDQSPLHKLQWVGISAEKAELSGKDNYARHRALGAEIRRRGYDPIEGRWKDYETGGISKERSYLVFGMPNQEAIDLSRDFDQQGVATPTAMYNYKTGMNNPATGEPTQIEAVGQKGAKILKDADANYGMVNINGQEVRYSHQYDWDHETETRSPNDAHEPTARTQQELRVNLGPVADPQTVQALADLGRNHSVGMKAYLHGDVLKPNGFSPVAEHVFSDNAKTYIHQSTGLQDQDPNGVHAYLPEGDALAVYQGRHPYLDSARQGDEDNLGAGQVLNSELRVVTPNPELGTNMLHAQINGERQRRFALYVPDYQPGQTPDLPELAIGDDAKAQLASRPTGRIVGIEVKGNRALLTVPAVNGKPDMVLGELARELLARHGVKVGAKAISAEEAAA